MHVPDSQRKKLDAKSRKAIFVGYPENVKGYKLYDPVSRKFTRSRDVIFQEEEFHYFNIHCSMNNGDSETNIPVMIEEIPINQNQVEDNQRVINDIQENQEADNEQVGATFEETFMNEVQNVGEQRIRRPPNRFDEECYIASDITADINEPATIDEAFSGGKSAEWKQTLLSSKTRSLQSF